MITVAINTYNAEKHLRTVLESVKDFDEILICDMHSTDNTISIANEFNCRIILHANTGYVEAARNYIIQAAKFDWVFVLDADEVAPYNLKSYLYELISRENPPDGVRIARKNYFMGKYMRAVYPDYTLRFFKKDKIDWPAIIHTQPKIKGTVLTIPKKRKDLALVHLANETVAERLSKTNTYSEYEIPKRKNEKCNSFSLLIKSSFHFFKRYVIKGGFLDGEVGLIFTGLNAFYKYVTIAKIIETRTKHYDMEKDCREAFKEAD